MIMFKCILVPENQMLLQIGTTLLPCYSTSLLCSNKMGAKGLPWSSEFTTAIGIPFMVGWLFLLIFISFPRRLVKSLSRAYTFGPRAWAESPTLLMCLIVTSTLHGAWGKVLDLITRMAYAERHHDAVFHDPFQ